MPLSSFVDVTSLEALANMVVTDTKIAQPLDSVTQRISVLRAEDIERQPANNRNLAELMRHTAGQFVNVLSRNDANWGAYAGLGPKYNTYLLDGLPIDSFIDAMSLDAAAIERVEIHKGPASVLYSNYLSMDFAGNEAPLAGTTNFILKNHIEKPLTRLSAGLGSYGTYQAQGYTQGRKGDLSYLLGVNTEAADYTQYGAPGSWLQTVDAPDYTKTKLFGNLSYELGRPDHTIALFLHHTGHDGDMGRPNRDFQHRYETLNLTYNNLIDQRWHIQFKAGERRYDRLFGNDNYPANLALASHDSTRQIIRPMDLTVSHIHGDNSLLTLGVDSQNMEYRTSSRNTANVTTLANDARAQSLGFFLQEKLHWQNWVLRAGIRRNSIEHDYALLGGNVPATRSASWSKNLWSLGARYNVSPDLSFYGNAGSSFMVPSAKQIGGTVANPGASGQLANPGLKPEAGMGSDFGLDWQISPSFNFGLRAFDNKLQDAIVDNAVGLTQTISVNAGQARARGLEIEIQHTLLEDLSWFANLTRTWSNVSNQGTPDQDGTAIPFAPDTTINLGFTAQLPGGWTLSPYAHWVGRYYDSTSRSGRLPYGEYGVLNARLRHAWQPGIDVVIDLNNVTNHRFDMPWGFVEPGFQGLISLNFTR